MSGLRIRMGQVVLAMLFVLAAAVQGQQPPPPPPSPSLARKCNYLTMFVSAKGRTQRFRPSVCRSGVLSICVATQRPEHRWPDPPVGAATSSIAFTQAILVLFPFHRPRRAFAS